MKVNWWSAATHELVLPESGENCRVPDIVPWIVDPEAVPVPVKAGPTRNPPDTVSVNAHVNDTLEPETAPLKTSAGKFPTRFTAIALPDCVMAAWYDRVRNEAGSCAAHAAEAVYVKV